jgi:YVTN family beta-propeller protein
VGTGGRAHDRAPRTFAAVALALALAAACKPLRRGPAPPVEATSSRVDVFLRCQDASSQALVFELSSLRLRDAAGALRELDLARRSVSSSETALRVKIGGAVAPPAQYTALVLGVERAWQERPEGRLPLELRALGEPTGETATAGMREYELPLNLRLGERDAASVFVEWRATDSLTGGVGFAPALSASFEAPQTALALIYVADAASGSVLAIDRASAQIVGTYKAGAEPRALALLRDRRRALVANSGDGSITVIDVRNGRVESTIPIAFGARTSDVALADPARWAAAANPALDSVSLVSLAPDGATFDVPVGRSPVRLAVAPDLGRVFVVESGGDSLSVIDVPSRAVVAEIAVESRPSDVDVDRDQNEAFVVHTTSPNLLVVDAEALSVVASIFVGADATDVLADPRRSRIYVARARPSEIVVVERRLAVVVRRIPLSARVESMAISREGGRIYAAAPQAGAVIVVDVVRGKEEAAIRCGSRPVDVVVAE